MHTTGNTSVHRLMYMYMTVAYTVKQSILGRWVILDSHNTNKRE